MLHLSGSTDILGVIVKCMQEVGHHFKLAGEDVSRELSIIKALRIKLLDSLDRLEVDQWEYSLILEEHTING